MASDRNSFAQITGDIPYENSLLRQVSSLLRRLPAIESVKFQDDFLMVSCIVVSHFVYQQLVQEKSTMQTGQVEHRVYWSVTKKYFKEDVTSCDSCPIKCDFR